MIEAPARLTRADFIRLVGLGAVGTAIQLREAGAQVLFPDGYSGPRSMFPHVPAGSGQSFNGRFELPGWAKLLTLGAVRGGTTTGTTKLIAGDEQGLLLVLDAQGTLFGKTMRRDALLSFRRDPANPDIVKFASRVASSIDPAVIASAKNLPSVDQRIEALLGALGKGEQVDGKDPNFESDLYVERAEPGRLVLRTEAPRRGRPRGEEVVIETTPAAVTIRFKGNELSVAL